MIDLALAEGSRMTPNRDDPPSCLIGNMAIVALAVPDWDFPWWVDRQHLLSRLAARGWTVVYSGGNFTYYDRNSYRWNKAGIFPKRIGHHAGPGSLTEYLPGKLETVHWRFPVHMNWAKQRFAGRLRAMDCLKGRRLVAYITHPRFYEYVDRLKPDYLVLHVNDAWPRMRGWTARQQRNLENLVRRADLIIAMGQQMATSLPLDGPDRAHIIQHGVDERLLERDLTGAVPEDLRSVPKPRIGYFGRISQKIDFQVILDVARSRPTWQWVFLGLEAGLDSDDNPHDSDLWRACLALPNVHFLGRKSTAQIPLYMACMDALALPYKSSGAGYWTEIFPLKLFECFAAGKPVVAADVPALRPYERQINLTRTQRDWTAFLESVLTGHDKASPDERIAYARDNTWQQRAELLESHLLSLVASSEAGKRVSERLGQ